MLRHLDRRWAVQGVRFCWLHFLRSLSEVRWAGTERRTCEVLKGRKEVTLGHAVSLESLSIET